MATRTYTKVARAVSEERTREALLDAAEGAFFARGGPNDVAIVEVASAAGVSKHTLLRHFGSKQGLLDAAFERGVRRVEEERLAAPTDDIEGAVANLICHYEAHGERALKLAAVEGSSPVADLALRGKQLHYGWIDHAFGRWLEELDAPDRRRARAALIAICDVHTWKILARDLALGRAQVRATLVSAIRRLLEAT